MLRSDETNRDWQAALPSFSASIFRTAPYLGLGGPAAQEPRLVGGMSVPTAALPLPTQAKPWLERRPSSGRAAIGAAAVEARPGADHAASTLPSWLLRTLQDHQRQMASLFNSWEMEGRSTVPLSQFAQGVRDRCGFSLSDDELRQMLAAVHPERGEPPVGRSVREQPLDYKLLTRAVKMNAGRKASTYIRRSSSAGLVS